MSIRRRLLVFLLSSVLAGGLLASGVVFFRARAEANELFDYQLRQLALSLRDRSYDPAALAQVLQGEEALDFAIQVWGRDGSRLYLSGPDVVLPQGAPIGFADARGPQGEWRLFTIQQRGLTIQVGQPMAVRDRLALAAAWRTLLPFLVALPLFGLLIWRFVGRELAPLDAAARAVERRSPASLEALPEAGAPEEIRPLVLALNGLLARLARALEGQRRFVADAAHELRTPLTALALQLQLAERAGDERARREAHATLRAGIARASRLVEQLLALAREDPESPGAALAPVDLSAVAAEALAAHMPAAAAKRIDLGASSGPGVFVTGDGAALARLAGNLVDNAVRYTQEGGTVTVSVRREGGEALLCVEDDGPGIPAAERERVFDRFYRGAAAPAGGSGLGLAIVRAVADRHGARVEIGEGPRGRGLRVRVAFPGAGPAPGAA